MDESTRRRLLGLLGLGVRGRLAVVGVQQVRDAAKRGTLALAVVAPDVSRHSKDKIVPLLVAKHVRVIEGPSASELGAAVGRETTAAIGVVDRQLARGIRALVEQGPDRGRESGPSGTP
ncbi:MAG TPA: ribosomal L7Ae/L30e/S12e/Gadd45 family protein [Gemmatimonadaceae bacterium]|nr:ribosomal L7Ae/L30e/S12e/Gadd45 family protein [Gemmatimonadaceae bacterium]